MSNDDEQQSAMSTTVHTIYRYDLIAFVSNQLYFIILSPEKNSFIQNLHNNFKYKELQYILSHKIMTAAVSSTHRVSVPPPAGWAPPTRS